MTNKEKTPLKTILASIVSFALAFAGASFGYRYMFGGDESDLDSALMATADRLNQNLPIMLDKETRFDASIGINRTFLYKYTLVNYAAEDIDKGQFETAMESILVNHVCTTSEMEFFVNNHVPVEYAYYGKNGKHITTITVTKDQCES